MSEKKSNYSSLDIYESIVRGLLTEIYTARKKTKVSDWMEYSNLLIDKFAIHSMSFFHLSKGIVEHKKSGEQKKIYGYDLFTVNTTFRALLETYVTFHNLFIEPQNNDEEKFRFLLWKIDGLYQKRKYDIGNSDFENAKETIEKNELLINQVQEQIEQTKFFLQTEENQLLKIYNPDNKKANWRFIIKNKLIKPKKIIDLVQHVCKQKGFVNLYKYTSLHSHSNFPAIIEFKDTRGKVMDEKRTSSIINYAMIMTCLLISDICEIDKNAKLKFESYESEIKEYITGITTSIRKEK